MTGGNMTVEKKPSLAILVCCPKCQSADVLANDELPLLDSGFGRRRDTSKMSARARKHWA